MASNSTIPTELGTENIGKLLKQYALPAIIAMVASVQMRPHYEIKVKK